MSLSAMTWAVEAPIDRPTAKLALVCLADHADEEGVCFPSQKSLAAKVGVSDRALRDALSWLEEHGFITRSSRHRKDGSRTSDAYQLPEQAYRKNFPTPRKQTPPLPEDTSDLTSFEPVTEPTSVVARPAYKHEALSETLLEAAGLNGFRTERAPGLLNLAPVLGLLDAKFDLEAEILPAIRWKASTGFKFRSWVLLTDVVPEFAERRRGAASTPRSEPAKPVDWAQRVTGFYEENIWPMAWGPKPGDPGCEAPAELIDRTAA